MCMLIQQYPFTFNVIVVTLVINYGYMLFNKKTELLIDNVNLPVNLDLLSKNIIKVWFDLV